MTYFLFGTLWSVLFWVAYIAVSFFVTVIVLRTTSPRAFKFVTGIKVPERPDSAMDCVIFSDNIDYVAYTVMLFMFWPLVLMLIVAYCLVIKIGVPVFTSLLIKTAKMTPTITFGKQEKQHPNTKSNKYPEQ